MTAYLSACLRDTAAQEFLSFRLRRRLFGFPHQLGHHLAGALHQLRPSRFFTIQEVAMKITISIGEQRLTIVAQGDEYEIVLPDRLSRTQTHDVSATAAKAESEAAPASSAPPLPAEDTEYAQSLLRPEVLALYGLRMDTVRAIYQYVRQHDKCKFKQISKHFDGVAKPTHIKHALSLLRSLGCVYKDRFERYTTRLARPSASEGAIAKVLEVVEALPGLTMQEIANMLGLHAQSGSVSDSLAYLSAVGKIRKVPEINGIHIRWRYYSTARE